MKRSFRSSRITPADLAQFLRLCRIQSAGRYRPVEQGVPACQPLDGTRLGMVADRIRKLEAEFAGDEILGTPLMRRLGHLMRPCHLMGYRILTH